MSALLLLVGLVLAIVAALRVCGIRDLDRTAVALVMITAPLEVYRTETVVGNVSLFRIALLVAVVAALRDPVALRRHARSPVVAAGLMLVILMAISIALVSDNRPLAISIFGQAVIGATSIAFVAVLISKGNPLEAPVFLGVGASVALLIAGAQGIAGGLDTAFVLPLLDSLPVPDGLEVTRIARSQLMSGELRIKSAFSDPNHFAAFLVIAAFTGLALTTTVRVRSTRFVAATGWTVAVLVILTATLSRTGWLAAATGFVALSVVVVMRPESRTLVFGSRLRIAVVIAVAFVAALFVTGPVLSRLDSQRGTNAVSNAVHERTMTTALREMLESPITGVGVADLGPILSQNKKASGAHSSFLTVGAELGIPGFFALIALFAAVIAAFLGRAARDPRHQWVFWIMACGYGGYVAGNVVYDLHLDDFHWATAAIAAAMPWAAPERSSDGDDERDPKAHAPQDERSAVDDGLRGSRARADQHSPQSSERAT